MAEMARDGVDVRALRFGPRLIFIANHPKLVRDILINDDWNFIKGRGLRTSKPVLGQGLLTSEGELHRRQRRLVQPAFHSARLAGYAQTMVDCTLEAQARWTEDADLAIDREMAALTLRIVGKTLFSADLEHDAGDIGHSLRDALQAFHRINSPLAMLFKPARTRATKQAAKARAHIGSVMVPIIQAHREDPGKYDDMLSMLMAASEGGAYMSDELLQDECLTLFLAGHETTANALTWAWYLLAQNPEVLARLTAELDTVLGARPATVEDFPRLTYTGRVFREVLRLYPPAWIIVREALTAYKLGDLDVPAGAQVAVCPYATHHDPRFWDAPETFRPERWETITTDRNDFAFFPFAAGTRNCIGEGFATMEGVLLIATIAQRLRLDFIPTQPVEMWPQLTLRPKHSLHFRVHRR
jgi:cytochrome P450